MIDIVVCLGDARPSLPPPPPKGRRRRGDQAGGVPSMCYVYVIVCISYYIILYQIV